MKYLTKTIDGLPAVQGGKWQDIIYEAGKHHRSQITVESYSELKEWSEGQRKWFKGVLLPALAKSTGDSLLYWENKLKKNVMPDDFPTITEEIDGVEYKFLPSITTLGMTKMIEMVEGSVGHLRNGVDENDVSIYGDYFNWVTLPAKELKKK